MFTGNLTVDVYVRFFRTDTQERKRGMTSYLWVLHFEEHMNCLQHSVFCLCVMSHFSVHHEVLHVVIPIAARFPCVSKPLFSRQSPATEHLSPLRCFCFPSTVILAAVPLPKTTAETEAIRHSGVKQGCSHTMGRNSDRPQVTVGMDKKQRADHALQTGHTDPH